MKQESATDPGDYVQHPVINHDEKRIWKGLCMSMDHFAIHQS